MSEKVLLLSRGYKSNTTKHIQSDLELLGFKSVARQYSELNNSFDTREPADVILFDLTVINKNIQSICTHLLDENVTANSSILFGILSEKMIGSPLLYKFTDVIKFPYETAEFGFRLRRLLHQHSLPSNQDVISIGQLSITQSRREVKSGSRPVELNYQEYELLKYLMTHPNRVLTREELLNTVWAGKHLKDSRTVDVYIRRLREKIGDTAGKHIKTIHGVGYTLRSEND